MTAREVTYEEVQQLADKLSREDQERLIDHLYEVRRKRVEEWTRSYLASATPSVTLNNYSDRREDWYDDEGR